MNRKSYLVYLLPIRSIVFLLVFVIGAWITKQGIDGISNWWTIVASVVNIITILMIVLLAKKSKSSYRELINLQKGKTKIKQIVIMTMVILFIGTIGMYVAGFICYGVIPYMAPMMIAPIAVPLAIINVFVLPITTALAEEGLYLGCGVNQIKNKYVAIFVPALFFALQHSFIPTVFDFKYIIYRFLSFLPLTIILCWYYYKKRNPLPIMIGHAILDVATVMMVLATSVTPELFQMMCNM